MPGLRNILGLTWGHAMSLPFWKESGKEVVHPGSSYERSVMLFRGGLSRQKHNSIQLL